MNNLIDIYHGSTAIVQEPKFGFGSLDTDYGQGFYCTPEISLAYEWAAIGKKDGYCNCYTFNAEGLTVLDLNREGFSILHMAAMLLNNRRSLQFDIDDIEVKEYLISNFLPDFESADIIIGYRADDMMFNFISNFMNGRTTIRQLKEAFLLGDFGQQFVLKSRESFERIQFVEALEVPAKPWYAQYNSRESRANHMYSSRILKGRKQPDDIRLEDVVYGKIPADDIRLFYTGEETISPYTLPDTVSYIDPPLRMSLLLEP